MERTRDLIGRWRAWFDLHWVLHKNGVFGWKHDLGQLLRITLIEVFRAVLGSSKENTVAITESFLAITRIPHCTPWAEKSY